MRAQLLSARAIVAKGLDATVAEGSLNGHLIDLLASLEPDLLGVYWAVRGEFSLSSVIGRTKRLGQPTLALPFARTVAASMDYRRWSGEVPSCNDECGIPSADGAVVVPEVVVVPCVGFTRSGYRLGYGGGYFDRWLASNPSVTTIGVAWSITEVGEDAFDAQPHDIPMTLIVTEHGVAG